MIFNVISRPPISKIERRYRLGVSVKETQKMDHFNLCNTTVTSGQDMVHSDNHTNTYGVHVKFHMAIGHSGST